MGDLVRDRPARRRGLGRPLRGGKIGDEGVQDVALGF
jgi:hypothetical protein